MLLGGLLREVGGEGWQPMPTGRGGNIKGMAAGGGACSSLSIVICTSQVAGLGGSKPSNFT